MSRTVIWSPRARDDLRGQLRFIGEQNTKNAQLVSGRVQERVGKLAHMPTGHQGQVKGTFETVVQQTSLILVYRIVGTGRLQIVRLIHAARPWNRGEWPDD